MLSASLCRADDPSPSGAAGSSFRFDSRHTGIAPGPAGPALSGLRWKFATRGPIRGSPVVFGGVLLFGSGDGFLYALEATTGRERWRVGLGGAVASTPAVAEGLVVATARERAVTAVDLATGRERWRFTAGPDLPFRWEWDFWLSSPAIAGGRVYVGSGDGNLYALELETGRRLWQFATGGRVRSSPAIDGGVVYVGSMDGKLYALDAATGELRWTFQTAGVSIDSERVGFDRRSIVSSPAVTGGLVFFGSRDARLYAVDRKTGAERWRFGHRVESRRAPPK